MKRQTNSLIWALLLGAACGLAEPVDVPAAWPDPQKVSFFKIPATLKRLKSSEQQLRTELGRLPLPTSLRPVEAYGFHGGYLPALEELPSEPRWTVKLKFQRKVNEVMLVPALDHRFKGTESYGFPRRFRIIKVRETGERSLVKEWMKEDCPEPGAQSPLVIGIKNGLKSYIFELEVFRGAVSGDQELFALDEIYGGLGPAGMSACTSIAASSEYESRPYWSKDYLVDQRSSLGLPTARQTQSQMNRSDFKVVFDSPTTNSCLVELDMGENDSWNQITLLPAQPPEDLLIPGYGFPRKLAISIIKDLGDGKRGRAQLISDTWGSLHPGNNPLNIALPRSIRKHRWIQLRFADLPVHNAKQVFAMGEIGVSRFRPIPVKAIRVDGFPADAGLQPERMINGTANGRKVLSVRSWLEQLVERYQLSQQLDETTALAARLQLRWKRSWQKAAIVFAAVFVLGALGVVLFLVIHRRRALQAMKWKVAQEKHQTELEQMKLRFFTHVSHELRTPLSVISGTVAKLEKEQPTAALKQYSQLAQRNVKKLQRLVDQLLDFRKLQERKETLDWESVQINRFIQNGFDTYRSMAADKNIDYQLTSLSTECHVSIDCGKLQKIVDNLISNALKYTAPNGTVAVALRMDDAGSESLSSIRLEVKDSGAGIAAEDLPYVFEQFYRAEGLRPIQASGSGIGLALVKELVELWGGSIEVVSPVAEGQGTCFTVALPAGPEAEFAGAYETSEISAPQATPSLSHKSGRILLVEDNEDVRSFIRLELGESYQLCEAENGKAGLQKALETVPDLIISDVMMPEMDGIELCKHLKTHEITSHIPVIMLTARASQEHQIEGLKTGADDYVAKPFAMPLLHARIQNLLESRRKLRERFRREVRVEPSAITVTSTDEILLQRAIRVVEENMNDCDFGVPGLVAEMHIARSTLFVKLRALVDQSPQEFIRTLRLKRARQLLEQSTDTIAEIAFQVGFAEPTNFSRGFKKQFGITPSAFRNSQKNS